jgi:hypothetical protein
MTLVKSWLNRWAARGRAARSPEAQPTHGSEDRLMAGPYESLYQYLEKRYANLVVLTFGQIEDLLGFALPASARTHQEWWTNDDPPDGQHAHSRSWILASRTATPNLRAQTVAFERAQG